MGSSGPCCCASGNHKPTAAPGRCLNYMESGKELRRKQRTPRKVETEKQEFKGQNKSCHRDGRLPLVLCLQAARGASPWVLHHQTVQYKTEQEGSKRTSSPSSQPNLLKRISGWRDLLKAQMWTCTYSPWLWVLMAPYLPQNEVCASPQTSQVLLNVSLHIQQFSWTWASVKVFFSLANSCWP